MIRTISIILISLCIVWAACSNKHGEQPTAFQYVAPPTPTDFTVTPGPEEAHLSWNFPAEGYDNFKEFRVYLYVEVYDMAQLIGTTTDTDFVDGPLVGNLYYCYRVSAVDSTGFEGWLSEHQCAFIPSN